MPPIQLYGGSIADFDAEDSMAKAIEAEIKLLIGLPPGDPEMRRRFLIAIARGVIQHLHDKQAAFEISVAVGPHPTVTTHPNILIRT